MTSDKTIFQTLKLFPMQNFTETPSLKETKYIRKKQRKKAIKTLP